MVGAVFTKGLPAALLDVLHLVACAFYPVADYRSTDQANHRGQCPPTAIANRIPNSPASHRAVACFGRLGDDLLAAADLARHSNLVDDWRAGDDSGKHVSG